jgi:type IV pilus assembly protein PilW
MNMKKKNMKARIARRAAGFTLVEIMIGLLIGLIGIVVIMETFAVSEGYRRTTTSGTDAQVNGAIAMYLMERELRIAGYNLQPYIVSGCTSVVVWYENLGKSRLVRFVPVEINPAGIPAGDVNTDVILISYGNADTSVSGIVANQKNTTTDPFDIKVNYTSFRNGDLLFSMQPSAVAGGAPSCVLHELTNVPNASGNCGQTQPPTPQLAHDSAQYKNFSNGCQVAQANHNAAGGIKDQNGVPVPRVDSASGGQVYSMGPTPSAKIYAIRSGNLTVCETFSKDCTDPNNYDVLVNDIVSMRAILGGDYVGGTSSGAGLLGDGSIDQWSRNAFNNSGDVRRTIAIAFELTARSGLLEKSSTGSPDPANCDATKASNLPDAGQTADWYASYVSMAAGSLVGAKIDLSQSDPQGHWNCYRYKMFQSVVPLRNLLWTPG